jgi:hypothetical protein
VFVATAGDKMASRVAQLAALYTHTGRKGQRGERERESNTEDVTRLKEGAREGHFPSLLVTTRRGLVGTTRDGSRSRNDPKCAPQAVKICTHG